MSSASVPDDAIMLIAAGNWARSTRAGTEPKLAASNHTKAVPIPNADDEDLWQRESVKSRGSRDTSQQQGGDPAPGDHHFLPVDAVS